MAVNTSRLDDTTRMSIYLPKSLKRRMDTVDVNWSAFIREAIKQRLEHEFKRDVAEAVLISDRLSRLAPKGWDSTREIRYWRNKRR